MWFYCTLPAMWQYTSFCQKNGFLRYYSIHSYSYPGGSSILGSTSYQLPVNTWNRNSLKKWQLVWSLTPEPKTTCVFYESRKCSLVSLSGFHTQSQRHSCREFCTKLVSRIRIKQDIRVRPRVEYAHNHKLFSLINWI